MPIRRRQIAGEVGAAVAVLALYLLVLLAPLHQVAGMQRELALLGFESSLSWSVCTSVADADRDSDDTPTAAKCPLAGVAKSQFAAVLPPMEPVSFERTVEPVRYIAKADMAPWRAMAHPGQPRGPPEAA